MDLALIEPCALDARADRIGGLAHEQRLVAGYEIGSRGLTCEGRTQSFERKLQCRWDFCTFGTDYGRLAAPEATQNGLHPTNIRSRRDAASQQHHRPRAGRPRILPSYRAR